MNDATRREQFESFYAENADRVYRFALRLVGNKEDAEDLAAESLADAFRHWDRYRGDASYTSWACGIVLNRWRMQRRVRKVPLDPLHAAHEVAATFQFPNLELSQELGKLPSSLRIAFLLVKGEGLTHAEAAKALRVPVGTVYFRVHVAIRKLRASMDPNPRAKMASIEVICDQEL